MNKAAVIIPARFGSTRLPGKPLIQLANKPMIQWVYERALQIRGIDQVVIATDDERIVQAVKSFNGEVYLTPGNITTGTERVGFLAEKIQSDIIINLQGDEPLVPVNAITDAITQLRANRQLNVATLGSPLTDKKNWCNPSVVKLLVDINMNAIYFSRAPIPYLREQPFSPLPQLLHHIGVYIFQKSFLFKFLKWPESALEKKEKLEQLRILEHGYPIRVIQTNEKSIGVDTWKDVSIVEAILKKMRLNS